MARSLKLILLLIIIFIIIKIMIDTSYEKRRGLEVLCRNFPKDQDIENIWDIFNNYYIKKYNNGWIEISNSKLADLFFPHNEICVIEYDFDTKKVNKIYFQYD